MDSAYIQAYEDFELRHWWFIARRERIIAAIDRHARGNSASPRWLDVGCGTGVLLAACPAIQHKLGLEMDPASVARGRAKGLDIRPTGPHWDLTPYGTFDLITLCDVLEHVEHEPQALQAAHAALKPGGLLLVTVPALMSLWSSHDLVNRHVRRYHRRQLLDRFDPGQWEVLEAGYFSSFLLPLIWTARKAKNLKTRLTGAEPSHDFKFGPRWLDRLLLGIFRLETRCARHLNMPLGSSLLLVARKRAEVSRGSSNQPTADNGWILATDKPCDRSTAPAIPWKPTSSSASLSGRGSRRWCRENSSPPPAAPSP